MTKLERQAKKNLQKHREKLSAVRDDLRQTVNGFLQQKGIDLHVEAIHFSTAPLLSEGSFRCCTINGKHICGPQCP